MENLPVPYFVFSPVHLEDPHPTGGRTMAASVVCGWFLNYKKKCGKGKRNFCFCLLNPHVLEWGGGRKGLGGKNPASVTVKPIDWDQSN